MNMIYQLCPTYDDLKYEMEKYPIFIAKVVPDKNEYTLTIEEESRFKYLFNSCEFDRILSWTDQKLEKWRGCTKTSPNTWNFISQKDAEKFQTLFYLSWNQSGIR